jgi:diguanylate cyclase
MPKRYTEPKARSAELLRLALAHMGRCEAAFNPITFTVCYEYAAGINPRLTEALDSLQAGGQAVDDAAMLQLYQAHIRPPDGEAVAHIGLQMQQVMRHVAQSATQAGLRAGAYGEQLSGLSRDLAQQGGEPLAPRLNELLAGTADMQTAVQALQRQVQTSQFEIERLRGDLNHARDEALQDALTGVLNRKGFDRHLAQLLDEQHGPLASHCLLMFDIDHFKQVNDNHGHVVGDRVIQAVAEILRSTAAVTSGAAARYGGEEFAILLPKTTLDRSTQVAEDVRLRTKAMKIRDRRTHDVLLTVTLSGGVAALQPGDDAAALVQRADAALYRSKQAGRDRVTRA